MKKGVIRLFMLNSIGVFLTTGWAYTAHMQDMINVGGMSGDYDYWLKIEPFISFPSIIIWLTLVVGTPIHASRSRLDWKKTILLFAINLGAIPVVFLSFALWLDRGLKNPA